MYFYTWTRLGKLWIDVTHTVITEISFGILTEPLEFAFYLHAIHSVKLTNCWCLLQFCSAFCSQPI